MPILPNIGSPYTRLSAVLEMARVRANDASLSIDGELLSNDQPYIERMVNAAWKKLQGKAATAGVETYIREETVTGIPPAMTWGNQCFITWQGSGEVGPLGFQSDLPALPPDLIMPLTVWCQSGNAPMQEMRQSDNGLPIFACSNEYDWRRDGMYFYGFQNMPMNLRIRYSAAYPDLSIDLDTPIPMLYAEDCLAALIVFEFANARGGAQAGAMAQLADDAFQTLAQRTSRKNQRRSLRRQPYGGAYGSTYY